MSFISLGKLSHEQKIATWKNTISGSGAKYLIKEPWNVIREKLNMPLEHSSERDYLNNVFGEVKENLESAMANGAHYESWVLSEIALEESDLISGDICYQKQYPEGHPLKQWEHLITATPDFLKLDIDHTIMWVGEIKCSTQAQNWRIMEKRYYPQLLHNAYVMNTRVAKLYTKGFITQKLNVFLYNFEQVDFDNYEKLLLEFFHNYSIKNHTFYDDRIDSSIPDNNEELSLGQIFGEDKVVGVLTEYIKLKNELSTVELNKRSGVEKILKESWNTSKSFTFDGFLLKYEVKPGTEKINWELACTQLMSKYQIPINELEEFKEKKMLKSFKLVNKNE